MAGYGDFPTLASARRRNSIYKRVVKNCSLPRCRSKSDDSNGVYLKSVSVTVSLPIAFKAVSVLGDRFDEGLVRFFPTVAILMRCHSFRCLIRLANSLLKFILPATFI